MFEIHGDWKIEVCGNVIVQRFSDGWNEEAIIAYIEDFQAKATPLIGKEWAILSIFEDWELGVPEIAKHVEEHCTWFLANGCIKDCHVYTTNGTKEMHLERLLPPTDEYYERQIFTHAEMAVAWLASCGFVIENSNIMML
ncbi:hypothetical protein [Paraglaciecola sp. MB-3u-78]|jgi:hypothetical protein|uniref:hypothetical protein n=1 Tax=Paraglaciecola sp. MB-3u-78 TaxID=2058332 RepID=UPI000C33F7C1|nr:hypothetical protein [Paraglaciecola sp. MB-3u-78]PKH00508.1 hypothetical protein CXF95_02950 [Paraglaciecola sp. MB-3u-78]